MDDRRRAQEQRERASRQWQKKKDDIHSAKGPLFGPPVKIEQKNDPLARRIQDVLGDASLIRKENNISSSALIGVERTPQTPGVAQKTSKELFSTIPQDKRNENVKIRERCPVSNKEHRRSRSRSTDKAVSGSKSQNIDKTVPYKGKRPLSPSVQETDIGNELQNKNIEHRNSSSKSSSSSNGSSSSSKRDRSRSRQYTESERSHKSPVKSGLDPPEKNHTRNPSNHLQSPPNGLLPLKIPPSEKGQTIGENIDVILGEVAIKPPLTAIQTPRKEEPPFAKLPETKTAMKSSSKGENGRFSIRRVSSGGLGSDLLVSSDSEPEAEPIQEIEAEVPIQPEERESVPSKKENGKKSRSRSSAVTGMGKMSLSESSDSSDDSESESPSGSDSSSSEDEGEKGEEEDQASHSKDSPVISGTLNISKADSDGSAGSVGLFDVTGDTPAEKRKKSFNIERMKKELMNDTGNSSTDLTPTKEVISQSESSPEKPEEKNFNEGVDICFDDILNGTISKSNLHGEDMDSWKPVASVGPEVTSTSHSGKSTKSNNNGNLLDSHVFGIASNGGTVNDEKKDAMNHKHLQLSSDHTLVKVKEVPPKKSGKTKGKHSSSSEIIPDSDKKVATKSTKSKSKRSQAENSGSSKSNHGSSSSSKQEKAAPHGISESPIHPAAGSGSSKKSKSNSANVGMSTPKKQGKAPPKGVSKEWITSSDASSDEEEPRHDSSIVDIEGLSSPEKVKSASAIAASTTKESTPAHGVKSLSSELTLSSKPSVSDTKDSSSSSAKIVKVRNRSRQDGKSSHHPTKAGRLVNKSSMLDLNHIFVDVSAPDELLSPVPNAPNVQKRTKEVRKSFTKPVSSSSKDHGLATKEAEAVAADSTVTPGGNMDNLIGLQFVNGNPSIVVSIDLRFVNLPSKTSCNSHISLTDRKSGVSKSSSSSSRTPKSFGKGEGNIFQNLSKQFPIDTDLMEDSQHSSATTPDVPPSVPTFHIAQAADTCDEPLSADNNRSSATNSASRLGTETRPCPPKKQELVDVSAIIDLEGLRPPATKIPLKRRQGDSSNSRERSKKPRTEDRVCSRDNIGASPLESPHWSNLSDYDRRGGGGSRERPPYKRSRLENNSLLHDECSRSPSVRESPGWSTRGSDYRRTPWNEDYSDRESVHQEEDGWEHKAEGRSEHSERSVSSHGRESKQHSSHLYERDKWRERRHRTDRDRKDRKYSRDWDAPGDDQLAEGSHYDSRSPSYMPYSGGSGRGVGSQWGAMAQGHTDPYTDPRESRHRGGQYERGYDRQTREHRRTVPPVNHKLESADLYLEEAKALKHRADKIQDKTEKMLVYVDAFLSFIQCGYAMEHENVSVQAKICRMYHDTLKLIKYYVVGQDFTDKSDVNKKLAVFSFRIQSVLYLRLYKLKKNDTAKLKRILDDHNKSARTSVQAPSPYNNSSQTMSSTTQSSSSGSGGGGGGGGSGWKGTSGTPSPMSPQPSPAGSVGSVGSVGSGDHPKMVNGNVSSTTVCVPQRIHSVQQEYLRNMELLYLCHERWDMADSYMDDLKDYFSSMDRDCGCLTLQSSVPELVRYIKEGLNRLRGT